MHCVHDVLMMLAIGRCGSVKPASGDCPSCADFAKHEIRLAAFHAQSMFRLHVPRSMSLLGSFAGVKRTSYASYRKSCSNAFASTLETNTASISSTVIPIPPVHISAARAAASECAQAGDNFAVERQCKLVPLTYMTKVRNAEGTAATSSIHTTCLSASPNISFAGTSRACRRLFARPYHCARRDVCLHEHSGTVDV